MLGKSTSRIDGVAKVTGAASLPRMNRSRIRPSPIWSPAPWREVVSRHSSSMRRIACPACSIFSRMKTWAHW